MCPSAVQEKKQAQLTALDSQYQAKIMAEVERYQALAQAKEALNAKWDEQNATLVDAHEKARPCVASCSCMRT
jgi:cilia- and flagella-associated protein 57